MERRVMVLGTSGMLGRAVLERFEREAGIEALGTRRAVDEGSRLRSFAVGESIDALLDGLRPGDAIVNCIGMIKQVLDDRSARDRRDAVTVNAHFPYELAVAAARRGCRVIQIATDCVFSGSRGHYDEFDPHDAHDVYGQSKSLGEVPEVSFLNLRCSIIGKEVGRSRSLVGWLTGQPEGAEIRGYLDHRWNGVTTEVYADIVAGIVVNDDEIDGTVHLVPRDEVDKNTLCRMILDRFDRSDVQVVPFTTGYPVDRTLVTADPIRNRRLWAQGGFAVPASVAEMVEAMSG
jgi:dTDP-4-dehydrorhamnose reductase